MYVYSTLKIVQLNEKLLPLLLGFLLAQSKIKPRMATTARTIDKDNKARKGAEVPLSKPKVSVNIKKTADAKALKIMKIANRSIEIDQMIIPNVATCIIYAFRKKPRMTSGQQGRVVNMC